MRAGPAVEENVAAKSQRYAIRVRGLRKRFEAGDVLHSVDLDVERGRINMIIGGSGQGKSVLLKLLIGLLKPDAGHIWINGVDLPELDDYALNDFRRHLGMVFQYAALFDSLTVEENIAFPLVEHSRMSRVERFHAVGEAMCALDLDYEMRRKFPAELSGGQRKRVGLARALVLKPEIILYDEPTTGLDPLATKNVDDMIREISQATGVTSIVVSHDIASTFRIGDRVSMLYQGEIIASGTPGEVRASTHPYLRSFLDTAAAGAGA